MATYVFSDVHGHVAPLERVLARIAPSADDRFYCLGDMIDRGPDPLGVIRAVRALPNVRVLMGNHEDLMVRAMDNPLDGSWLLNWGWNGGNTTYDALELLSDDDYDELMDWARALPRWDVATVDGRLYLMAHAGVELNVEKPEAWDEESACAFMAAQNGEDLTWIREDFWGAPSGLSGENGDGPVVIAGHTPSVYLERMVDPALLDRPALGDDGRARMVRVGGDRWDIDAAAAAGSSFGQVLVLRLDDGEEFYEPIQDGE